MLITIIIPAEREFDKGDTRVSISYSTGESIGSYINNYRLKYGKALGGFAQIDNIDKFPF